MLWDRQDNESTKAYQAFLDYRDMGVARSLRALHERYNGQMSSKPPTKMINTIETWSVKNSWQERIKAWDEYQTEERNRAQMAARQKLIDDELEDYTKQLDKWRSAYSVAQYAEKDGPQQFTTDPQTGERIAVVRVATNAGKMHQLTRWRNDITLQGRRALGLPEKVERNEVTGADGGPLAWEQVLRRDDSTENP